jgi:hypothetical protein
MRMVSIDKNLCSFSNAERRGGGTGSYGGCIKSLALRDVGTLPIAASIDPQQGSRVGLASCYRIGLIARVLCNVMTSDWSVHFIGPDGKTQVGPWLLLDSHEEVGAILRWGHRHRGGSGRARKQPTPVERVVSASNSLSRSWQR